jgi:phospholipase/carboxylesterase
MRSAECAGPATSGWSSPAQFCIPHSTFRISLPSGRSLPAQNPHLPKRRVDETATVFARLGATVTQRVYPGLGHAISPDEIAHARGMLDAVWA